MNLDNQTLMILGLAALAVLNVPWSYLWSLAKSFKLPSMSGGNDKLIDKLGDIEQAIRDLGGKS
jgi:hypothetical protein